jgi:SAM-dependent methyltransferase
MAALHTATIFVSALLLFLVQPMFARMVLPLLGGSPSVWNTAMVFYQAALLAGYAYAHFGPRWLGVRKHAAIHAALMLAPLLVLPLAVPAGWTPPTETNPLPWLLALMSVAVGLPFFVVSATSPLLQEWFAATGHRHARDPYFLYAASNAGSLLALVSYPALVEPSLKLEEQSHLWSAGYGALVVLMAACALVLWRNSRPSFPKSETICEDDLKDKKSSDTITPRRRLHWLLLAFVPSSLMLGATTFLSSDIAAVPLLWVIPLGVYLLTFILAFARWQILSRELLRRMFPLTLAPLVMAFTLQAAQPISLLMLLHLAAFFVASMLCHTALAADRPEAKHLTEFYLWLSAGGVLGGAFNALLAPLVFNSVAEYPLTLVLACWLGLRVAAPEESARERRNDFLWPALLGLMTAAFVLTLEASSFKNSRAAAGFVFGVPTLVCFFFSKRPLRFALGVAAILLASGLHPGEKGKVLHAERSFFGVHRVTLDPTGQYHMLVHGKTLHGVQSLDPARRRESLTYYHRTGPIGQVLEFYGRDTSKKIAAVGLGGGSLAAFGLPEQEWTFYEIDPVVLKLARDERFFSFLRDSAAEVRVVLGDARLSLASARDGHFDLMILDAYSSDAIPVHLVTREALALYLKKLGPGGILVFHISNLHLDLQPVFANLAHDAGLASFVQDDTDVSAAEVAQGKYPSQWLVMARRAEDFSRLAKDSRWVPYTGDPRLPVWTDNYSSLLQVFQWR